MKSLACLLFLFSVVNLAIKFTNANNGLQHVLEIDVTIDNTTKIAFIPENLFTECLGGNVMCPSNEFPIDIKPKNSTGGILQDKIDEHTMLEIQNSAEFEAILHAVVAVSKSQSGMGLNGVRVKTYNCGTPLDAKLFASGSGGTSGSGDNTARIWDANTGDELKEFAHDHAVTSVAFHPNNEMIASGSWDKTVKLFNASTGQILQTFQHPNPFNSSIGGVVGSVSFSPHVTTKLATGTYDGYARIWNLNNGSMLDGHSIYRYQRVWDLSYSPDGETVAIAYAEDDEGKGQVWLWHVENKENCVDWFQGNPAWGFKVWNTTSQSCLQKLDAHTDDVYSVAFSLDRNLMATASADHTVKIWETHNNGLGLGLGVYPVHTIGELDSNGFSYGHTNDVRCVTFSLDGTMLASGSDDGDVRVFTTSDWELYDVFYYTNSDDESKSVQSVAFSPAGTKLIVGGFASTIMIIDLYYVGVDPILQEIAVGSTVYSVAFRQQIDFETIYERQLQFHCADNYVFNDLTATCEACPSGKYAQVLGVPEATFNVHDLTECISCNDDNPFNFRYTTHNDSGCLFCNAGEFFNHAQADDLFAPCVGDACCTVCPSGWAGPAGTEASVCTQCPGGWAPGYYDPHNPGHEHECGECPTGTEVVEREVNGLVTQQCLSCTRGKYNDEVASTCKDCPIGFSSGNIEHYKTGCVKCLNGRFSIRNLKDNYCMKCKDTEYLSLEDGKQVCKECNPYNFWLSRRETTYKNGWAVMKELYEWLKNSVENGALPNHHLGHVFQESIGNELVQALSGNLTDFTDFNTSKLLYTFCARLNVNTHIVNGNSFKMATVQCESRSLGKIFPFYIGAEYRATPYQLGYYIIDPYSTTVEGSEGTKGALAKKRSLVDRGNCGLYRQSVCYYYDEEVSNVIAEYNVNMGTARPYSQEVRDNWIIDDPIFAGDLTLTLGRCAQVDGQGESIPSYGS